MSNIYTIHPPKSDLILFYEIQEPNGGNTWGWGRGQVSYAMAIPGTSRLTHTGICLG